MGGDLDLDDELGVQAEEIAQVDLQFAAALRRLRRLENL